MEGVLPKGAKLLKKWTGIEEMDLIPPGGARFFYFDRGSEVAELDPDTWKYVECAGCNFYSWGFGTLSIWAIPEKQMTCGLYERGGKRYFFCSDKPETIP